MKRRRLIELLVVRWGFAAMVVVAIVAGIAAGAAVAIPGDIPPVALGAVPVYRVEVGVAVFFGLYLATMALVLAMHNRGFTEIGGSGVKAQALEGVSEDDFVVRDVLAYLADELDDLKTRLEDVDAR